MIEDLKEAPTMLEEVQAGMRKSQKSLPSKFFYDEKGSQLFEDITRVEEYYPSRTERIILEEHMEQVGAAIGTRTAIIEPGSGSSVKVQRLLEGLHDVAAYIPVEISDTYLSTVVEELRQKYPNLPIRPVAADYTQPFALPDMDDIDFKNYTVFYPGSTIGNFDPPEARDFLELLAGFLQPGGGLLIGVDVKKDVHTLEAAYNDAAGVTAAFNKNMLRHINHVLDADFNLDLFRHEARYNADEGRIEMHLEVLEDHTVSIDGTLFTLEEGESIHTENSYKYSPAEFGALVSDWFEVKNVWMDENELFSVQYLTKK